MKLQAHHLALSLLSILALTNAQFITSVTTTASACTPTILTTENGSRTFIGWSKPTVAPGGIAGVPRVYPKPSFLEKYVLQVDSKESFWNRWLIPEQSAQKLLVLKDCSEQCEVNPQCASVFVFLDARNQATAYWTCYTLSAPMNTADLIASPLEAYKFGTALNRQCFPPIPPLPSSSSSELGPTSSDPPVSEPSSQPNPSSTASSTTSTTSTAPTSTPSCFTQFVPPVTLNNFWPCDPFFIRAHRIENAESRFFLESDVRSPTASEMADLCASDCANLPPMGLGGNLLPPCKFALAFSENYGGVPDEEGNGGDYYRRCAFFTENITDEDLVDAEALLGFGRVKDQIGMNSLCYSLPPTSYESHDVVFARLRRFMPPPGQSNYYLSTFFSSNNVEVEHIGQDNALTCQQQGPRWDCGRNAKQYEGERTRGV